MNRREFLKGGLGGLFGMFLTWAGVVRGEKAEIVAEIPGLPPERIPPWQVMNVAYGDPVPDLLGAHSLPQQMAKVMAADLDREIMGFGDQVSDNVGWDASPDIRGWEWSPWPLYAGPEVEYETLPMTATADLAAWPMPEPWEGGFIRARGDGRFVCWDSDGGSDENGTGTVSDPVATEACARAIADLG